MRLTTFASVLAILLLLTPFGFSNAKDPNSSSAPSAPFNQGGDRLPGKKDSIWWVRSSTAKDTDPPRRLHIVRADEGGALSFWLDGTRYDWDPDDCRYHPMYPKRMWHFYEFKKGDAGKYDYEKRNAWSTDKVHESGSATPQTEA